MIEAGLLLPACLAVVGVVTGLMWRIPSLGRIDARVMERINTARWPGLADQALSVLRIAGTTGFFLAALFVISLARRPWALGLALAVVAAELSTKVLKEAIRRPRPFTTHAAVIVRLPRVPVDPSFPSADAMRAAFLGGLAASGTRWPFWVASLAIVGAVSVAFGRVRAGAHYPLDAWAGLLLGFGAALAWAGMR